MRYYIAARSSDLSVIGSETQLQYDEDSQNASTQKPGFALLQPEYIEVQHDLIGKDILKFRIAHTFYSERLVEALRKSGASGPNFIPASLDGHSDRLYYFNAGSGARESGATY